MPRLKVDEPRQTGFATGPPPLPKSQRKRQRSTSPCTSEQPAKKKRVFPSPRSQAVLAISHEQAKSMPRKTRKAHVKRLADEYGVGPHYARHAARKLLKGKELKSRTGVGGQNKRISEDDEQMIRSTLKEYAYELTFRQLEEKTGIAKSTLQRFMKQHKWRQVAKGTRPHLTEENQIGRRLWAEENVDNDWWDHVDLDEKWFYVWSNRRKLKLPPDVNRVKSAIRSKKKKKGFIEYTSTRQRVPAHTRDSQD
jgi:hypothetical protein